MENSNYHTALLIKQNRLKWITANYLLQAKKSIDSLMYMMSINREDFIEIEERKRSFYLNLCYVLENIYKIKQNKINKKQIKENKHIENIYYERDKHYAHRDNKYKYDNLNLKETIAKMKEEIETVKSYFDDILNISLDYVPHDAYLYRYYNDINFNKEENIKKDFEPLIFYIDDTKKNNIKPIYNLDEFISIAKSKNDSIYAPAMKIPINKYESLQNKQDLSIVLNSFYGTDIWFNS